MKNRTIIVLMLSIVFSIYMLYPQETIKIESSQTTQSNSKKLELKKESPDIPFAPIESFKESEKPEYEQKNYFPNLNIVPSPSVKPSNEIEQNSLNTSNNKVLSSNDVKKPEALIKLYPDSIESNGINVSANREQTSQNSSGRIGQVRNNDNNRGTGTNSSGETEEPSPSASPEVEDTLLNNSQARGYALLSLMQLQARSTTEAQVENLIDAEIKKIYLSVLIDGTFSFDLNYLAEVVERLNKGERELTLALYLSNGSTMRRFDTTPITESFNTIDPIEFRNLIQYDEIIRARFKRLLMRIQPIYSLNAILNRKNRNIAIVMLEDNLQADSYEAMRDVSEDVLVGRRVEFYRNPCIGCYRGNDNARVGNKVEYHSPEEIPLLGVGDGFTLDGAGYKFDFERGKKGISEKQLEQILDQTTNKGISYFGLWRFDRQGLNTETPIHPNERNYVVPSFEELSKERELLRRGAS